MFIMENIPACPVETTLLLIGNKWKVLILRDLLPGTKRFGELRQSIGKISQKVLTSNLWIWKLRASWPGRFTPKFRPAWNTA